VQLVVSRQLASQPKKGFLKVVVGLCRNVIVLQILLTVKGNLLGLDLAVFDFHFVSSQDYGDVFTDASEIAMPVGNILVGDSARHVKHNDCALSLDVVSVTETAKLFLSSRVPDVELDGSAIGVKDQGVDFDAQGGDILFFKLARQVALDKGRLADAAVAYQNELELGSLCCLCSICKE